MSITSAHRAPIRDREEGSGGPARGSVRVGFDLDGVVYDFRRAMSDYLLSRGYDQCTVEAAHPGWDFFEGWGFSLDEYMKHYCAGVDDGRVLRFGDPLPGSVDATRRLAEAGHTIHIVTDRSVGTEPGVSARHTAAWLADHGFVFHSLTFSSDKTVVPTDFFIDDRFENYVARIKRGLGCHLLTRPWNIRLGGNEVNRLDSIESFVAEILSADRLSMHAPGRSLSRDGALTAAG